jgi:RNA polymerase sigma factor (sigma-70 family)
MDVLKYESVIRDTMAKFKINRGQREDTRQECYLALLESTDKLDSLPEGADVTYAMTICRNRIIDLWNLDKKKIQAESLDDPRNLDRASRIFSVPGMVVSDEQLEDAVHTLDFPDYQVIYSVYFEGKTEAFTAKELGLTKGTVNHRKERGVQALKKYFEENV